MQLRAAEQWARDLPVTAGRGQIVDRNGRVLAANNTVNSVYVRPREVGDVQKLSSSLASILEIPYKDIYLKIGGANVSEVTVYKKAAKEQADK